MPAKKQTQTLFVRAPFAPVAGSTVNHYVVTTDASAALVVEVEGTGPASGPTRLALQPVFPGRLTFKPKPGSVIPDDPSAAGAPPIQGDLYLQLSPVGLRELARATPDLALPLLLGYLGITITRDFFTGTVLEALKNAKRPKTAEEKRKACKAFAEGKLSTDIKPEKVKPVYAFPSVQPDPGSPWGAVTLALGVRTILAASAKPPTLAELDAGAVMAPPDFAAIPIPFLYRQLRALPGWSRLAADGHAQHAFFDALARLEQAAAPGRWRRLRIFPLGERPAAAYPMQAFEAIQARATAGNRSLWEEPLPRLGELYQKRPDGETFRFELRAGTAVVPIGLKPDGERRPSLDLTWAAPTGAGAPPGIDVTAEVPRFVDPLAGLRQTPEQPPPDLEEGCYDQAGRCFDKQNGQLHTAEIIRPLQIIMRSFGYGVTAEPDGVFDFRTAHAVREFQREAKTSSRIRNGNVVGVTVTYTGAITGRVDLATWREILVWETNTYRSSSRYNAESAGRQVFDVAFATEAILGHVIVTSTGTRLGTVTERAGIVRGLFNTDGTALTTLITRDEFAGQTWEKRAVCEVALNEAKVFEAINSWDNSYLSVGLFQWTIGQISQEKGKLQDEEGELPALCARLDRPRFTELFGRYGLEVRELKGPRRDKGSPQTGRLFLDGERVEWAQRKEPFRSFRWAERFLEAAKTDDFRLVQYRHALDRLRLILGIELRAISPNGPIVTAERLLQSELLCALALDQHVNRPNHVQTTLLACLNALLDIGQIITGVFTDFPLTKNGPTTWLTHGMKRLALVKYKKNDPRLLTQADRDAFVNGDAGQQLRNFKLLCHALQTSDLVHPTTGQLKPMNQSQHDVLLGMYKWRRVNAETMTDAEDRARKIETPNPARPRPLGRLSSVVGQFTP